MQTPKGFIHRSGPLAGIHQGDVDGRKVFGVPGHRLEQGVISMVDDVSGAMARSSSGDKVTYWPRSYS